MRLKREMREALKIRRYHGTLKTVKGLRAVSLTIESRRLTVGRHGPRTETGKAGRYISGKGSKNTDIRASNTREMVVGAQGLPHQMTMENHRMLMVGDGTTTTSNPWKQL